MKELKLYNINLPEETIGMLKLFEESIKPLGYTVGAHMYDNTIEYVIRDEQAHNQAYIDGIYCTLDNETGAHIISFHDGIIRLGRSYYIYNRELPDYYLELAKANDIEVYRDNEIVAWYTVSEDGTFSIDEVYDRYYFLNQYFSEGRGDIFNSLINHVQEKIEGITDLTMKKTHLILLQLMKRRNKFINKPENK